MSYPQTGHPQPGPPPRRPRRNVGLVVSLVVFAVLFAVLAVAVVLRVTGDDETAGPAPATSATGTPRPGLTQPPSRPSGPVSPASSTGPTTVPAERVTAALAAAGFPCYQVLTTPVTVHLCYLEPQLAGTTGIYDVERVTLQSTAAGVQAAEVVVKSVEKPSAVGPTFTKAVRALSGSLLPAADVQAILAAAPTKTQVGISWGTATQRTFENTNRTLTVVARGGRHVSISNTKTHATQNAVLAAATRKGYRCYTKYSMRQCELTKAGVLFHVYANDPCEHAGPELAKACKNATASSVNVSAAFDAADPAVFGSIVAEFRAVSAVAQGGAAADPGNWIASRLNGKPYNAVFGGLEYEIVPGAGFHRSQANVVSLHISGYNPA